MCLFLGILWGLTLRPCGGGGSWFVIGYPHRAGKWCRFLFVNSQNTTHPSSCRVMTQQCSSLPLLIVPDGLAMYHFRCEFTNWLYELTTHLYRHKRRNQDPIDSCRVILHDHLSRLFELSKSNWDSASAGALLFSFVLMNTERSCCRSNVEAPPLLGSALGQRRVSQMQVRDADV